MIDLELKDGARVSFDLSKFFTGDVDELQRMFAALEVSKVYMHDEARHGQA